MVFVYLFGIVGMYIALAIKKPDEDIRLRLFVSGIWPLSVLTLLFMKLIDD